MLIDLGYSPRSQIPQPSFTIRSSATISKFWSSKSIFLFFTNVYSKNNNDLKSLHLTSHRFSSTNAGLAFIVTNVFKILDQSN